MLHTAKINDAPAIAPFEFAIVYDDGAVRFERSHATAPDLTAGLSQRERMTRLLAYGSKSTSALANDLGVTEPQVRSILSKDHGRRFQRLPDGSIGLMFK